MATRARLRSCSRWSTGNCTISHGVTWPTNGQAILSLLPPWSMRPFYAYRIPDRRVGRTVRISLRFPPRRCGAFLVDWARARRAQKRDGSARAPELEQPLTVIGGPGPDILALEEALKALSAVDERKGRVVELRFFGGLSAAATAEVLKISTESVLRDWKLAKAWLRRELIRGDSDGR
jgi:hypothetical protein